MNTLTLSRRVSGAAYLIWIMVEGIFRLGHYILGQFGKGAGPDVLLFYFLAPALTVMVLQSYMGQKTTEVSFRLTLILHQLSLVAYSLWLLLLQGDLTGDIAVHPGIRAPYLSLCTIPETSALLSELGVILEGVGRYTWKEMVKNNRACGYGPPIPFI